MHRGFSCSINIIKFTVNKNKTSSDENMRQGKSKGRTRREDEAYAGARSRGAHLALKKPGSNIVTFEHQCESFQLILIAFPNIRIQNRGYRPDFQ